MVRSRLGSNVLRLCALVLGLTALAGGIAQAETGAKWRVNGADVGDLLPQLTIKEIENATGSLSFKTAGGTAVLVLCTALAFTEGGKLTSNGGISLARIKGMGCILLLNEAFSKNCQLHSPGLPNGEILSERLKGLIVLDGGSELVKFTPENAKGETTKLYLILELGELCAIGEEVNTETTALGAGLWLADAGGNAGALAETVTHLVVEGLNTLLALGQPAKTLGSAVLGLAGEHNGLKWSGVPA